MPIVSPKPLKLRVCTGDSELLLELATAILERFVMQKYDVGLGELFASLPGYPQIHLPHKTYIQLPNLLASYDGFYLLLGVLRYRVVRFVTDGLKPDLDSSIDFVKLDLAGLCACLLFHLHEVVLAVQPDQFDWGEGYCQLVVLEFLHLSKINEYSSGFLATVLQLAFSGLHVR